MTKRLADVMIENLDNDPELDLNQDGLVFRIEGNNMIYCYTPDKKCFFFNEAFPGWRRSASDIDSGYPSITQSYAEELCMAALNESIFPHNCFIRPSRSENIYDRRLTLEL
jgi:hypothetical protein